MTYDDEIGVEVFAENPLTAFQQSKVRKRGRPKSLRDEELWGMRSSLLDALDRHWTQIGWELGRARNVEQLRAAFARLPDFSGRFQFFVRPSTSEANPQTTRLTQIKVGRLNEQIRSAYEQERKLQEKLALAESALQQARTGSQRDEIGRLCRDRAEELQRFNAQYERLQNEERDLRERLMDEWAYIAQTELLSFIGSRRYSFTPVNLANAMAGLPNMRWRQSVKRCHKLKEPAAPGFGYTGLQLLERVWKKSSKSIFLTHLEAELRKQPNTNFAAQDMRQNWYYLKRSADEVLRKKLHPREVPYRIAAEYRRKMSSRSAVDLVLEEEERLI